MKTRLPLLIALLITYLGAFAQSTLSSAEDTYQQTPQAAVITHLKFLQPDTYEPELSAKVIPGNLSKEEKIDAAVKIKQILDAKGLFIDVHLIPEKPNYTDSASGKQVYKLAPKELPAIYLERIDGKWYYSRSTMEQLDALHSKVFPFGSDLLINLFPEFGQKRFGGLAVWKWMGIALLILFAYLLHWLLWNVFNLILQKVVSKRLGDGHVNVAKVKKVARALSMMLVAIAISLLLPILQLPIGLSKLIVIAMKIVIAVFAAVLLIRVLAVAMFYFTKLADRTETTLDDQLLPIIRKGVVAIIVILCIVYILSAVGVNIATLIAGVGIGGLALALAAQDTVKNFLGSIMIFVDKPFQIGDLVSFSDVVGVVEEVGIRSTRIRTLEDSVAYVPNGEVANMIVNNLGLRVYRRWKTDLGLTYDTPPELIDAFVKGVRRILDDHKAVVNDRTQVHLNSFGASSLNIMLLAYLDVRDWTEDLNARHGLMLSIIRLSSELGVRFAFPTQTLFIEEAPGAGNLTPKYENLSPAEIEKQLEQFFGKQQPDKEMD